MSLMEQFSNPDTMQALSFGDKMAASAITMCMGIGVTFLILCILWAFIAVMGKVMAIADRPKTSKAPEAAKAAPAAESTASNENEIAAVIAAAIAAYEAEAGAGNGAVETITNLKVKRIVRVPNGTTLWTDAARNEHIDSRRV